MRTKVNEYRAFSKVQGMLYQNQFCIITGKEVLKLDPSLELNRYFPIEYDGGVIIMQFINLHDQLRKKIFEDDIVIFDGHKGVVKFSEQIPGWYIEYQKPPLRAIYTRQFNCTYGDGNTYIDSTIQVVGNIHQNPELK
jgi:uncharacterized phage protein (TIGR01671 family)